MKITKYILEHDVKDYAFKDKIFPDYSLIGVMNQEYVTLGRSDTKFDRFFDMNIFAPLVPKYRGRFEEEVGIEQYRRYARYGFTQWEGGSFENNMTAYQVHALPDFGDWIDAVPCAWIYPISIKFYDLLQTMNLPDHHFFDSDILFQGKLVQGHVLQLNQKFHYNLIHFTTSRFCNWDTDKRIKIGDEVITADSLATLQQFEKEKGWKQWGYERAVMKAEFADLDLIQTYQLGILISEKLKHKIEALSLTGMKITECPVVFDVLDTD